MKLFKSSIDAEVERKAVHKPSEWETSELSLRVKFLPSFPHAPTPQPSTNLSIFSSLIL